MSGETNGSVHVAPLCGGCLFAKIIPNDFSKRYCFGSPPIPVVVPAPPPQGRMPASMGRAPAVAVQMLRPVVGVKEHACSLYRPVAVVAVAASAQQDVRQDLPT